MKKILVLLLVIVLEVTLVECGARTLAEITSHQEGGGNLRQEVDKYTVVEVQFYGEKPGYDGQTNCCTVTTRHYKDNPASPSGKLMDPNAAEIVNIPCTFDENTLTLNGFDNYTYSVEEIGESEYVVYAVTYGYVKPDEDWLYQESLFDETPETDPEGEKTFERIRPMLEASDCQLENE